MGAMSLQRTLVRFLSMSLSWLCALLHTIFDHAFSALSFIFCLVNLNRSYRDPTWATLIYQLIEHILCLTPQQFASAVHPPELRTPQEPDLLKLKLDTKAIKTQIKKNGCFSIQPSLFLRVIIPSTGFTVVVRAHLDTGSSISTIATELATLLVENGASLQRQWPSKVKMFHGDLQTFYRSLLGLQLQSVGQNESVTLDLLTHHFEINERFRFFSDSAPGCIEVEPKLAALGIPMVTFSDIQGERTMWSEKEEGFEHRYDMIIGQDLLNRYFLLKHPYQTIYRFTLSLALLRTTMGLALMGLCSNYESFELLSGEEINRMKEVLLGKNQNEDRKDIKEQQKQIEEALTVDFSKDSKTKLHLKDYLNCLLSLVLYVHLLLFFLLSCPFTFLLQLITTLTFLRHFVPKQITSILHSVLLHFLLQQTIKMRNLYNSTFARLYYHLFGGFIPIHQMPFSYLPHLAFTVYNCQDSASKTVAVLIDTGSEYSYISSELMEEMQFSSVSCLTRNPNNVKDPMVWIRSAADGAIKSAGQFSYLSISKHKRYPMPSKFASKVSTLLGGVDISILHSQLSSDDESFVEQVRLGADQIPCLLTPDSKTNQIIPLGTDNLSAMQTSFGWAIQGKQTNERLSGVFNWTLLSVSSFADWKTLLAFIAFDLCFTYFVYFNL